MGGTPVFTGNRVPVQTLSDYRAVDILHVAIAPESGAERFLSFDAIRRQLAEAEGLDVQP